MGCGALLGISPSGSQDEDENGRGGTSTAGSGGSRAGGTGEGGAGDSSGATTGGTGEAGSRSTGGRSGNGGSNSGGSSATSGEGGEGGKDATDFPQNGDPCSVPGALACWFTRPEDPQPTHRRLMCEGETWVEIGSCSTRGPNPQRCDRRDGTCRNLLCLSGEPPGQPRLNSCFHSMVEVCGPDLVTIEHEPCVLGCDAGNRCREPAPGELIIDRPRSVSADENPWPERLIPVCWKPSAQIAELDGARVAVRIAVESLWSRESVVGFTGWGSCDSSQARVELDFADDCAGELARLPRDGYPGALAALPVTLCKSYYDLASDRHPATGTDSIDLELLGFVAQHVFGHVLGLEDELREPSGTALFMHPVLDLTTFGELRPEPWLLESLAGWYGSAPGRSLVSPAGRCLSYDSESDVLSASACDGSPSQAWEPRDDALLHASGNCIGGASEGPFDIDECSSQPTPDEEWLPARVRIHDWRGYCLKAGTLPNDLSLEWVNCDATWPPEQRFRIGFVGSGRVRIHATNTTSDRCLVAPPTWTRPSTESSFPEFGACDDVRAVFDAFEGTLGREGRCLTPERTPLGGAVIVFEPCGTASNQQFRFSGAFEREGHALTTTIGAEAVELSSTPLGPIPSRDQILDYRF
jgi:hypothetical protein